MELVYFLNWKGCLDVVTLHKLVYIQWVHGMYPVRKIEKGSVSLHDEYTSITSLWFISNHKNKTD